MKGLSITAAEPSWCGTAHVQESLQALHGYVGADEHVEAVGDEADGVAEQVEQRQRRERNRCLQLTALHRTFRIYYLKFLKAIS